MSSMFRDYDALCLANIEGNSRWAGQQFMARPSTVVPLERSKQRQNSSSRKRVLSSDGTPQPPSKHYKVLASGVPETGSTSDVSPAVSRELATVEACNQVTLQKPRDVVPLSYAPSEDGHRQHLSCLEKRNRKRKTRRGKKKNRKFLTKVTRAQQPSLEQQEVATTSKVDGKNDHGSPGPTCILKNVAAIDHHDNRGNNANIGIDTISDARVVSLANHGTTSEVSGHQNLVRTENNVNIHQAPTSATGASGCHGNDFNKTNPDDHNREDLLILVEKENGVAYAVCKGDDRVLGRGGFGIVYKGYKLEGTTKTPVAIKIVEKSSIDCFVEDDELGLVPEEVAMLNKIKGHPNAIQLVDYVQIYDFVGIIMERPVHCKDLFDILEQQTSVMSEIQARKMIKQLSSVLLAMEKKGIVHRDIKSENILVDLDNEQVKLIDFGLATTFTPAKTIKKFCGTRENTPPEYILNGEYEGPKEAVWTLGLLLYYLVCADEPFCNFLETTMKPIRVPSFLSSDLKDLLLGMLRKNPNRRLTMEQVSRHPWMTTQTNSLCLPFGYRRSFEQKI